MTWFVTRTRFTNAVPLTANPQDMVQINLVRQGPNSAANWGQARFVWTDAPTGYASETYTIWRLPTVSKETIDLEIFQSPDRPHAKRITIPNVVTAESGQK